MPRLRFAPVAVLAALLLPLVPGTANAAPSAQGLHHRKVDACADRGGGSARCFAIDRQAVRDDGTVQPATATTGLTPAQVKRAYGFSADATDGSGQTVAVVVAYDAPTIEADLATFSTQYGLPACATVSGCLTKVNQVGGTTLPSANAGWALETSLDVEWVHAMAPAAHILLVEANSAALGDLVAAVDYAKANAKYVSNSWGAAETSTQTSLDAHFVQSGVSFFVASGDSGSQSWPSTSPTVVSVGGTSLSFNPDGTVAAETAWSGSGGGCSRYDTAAAAQTPVSQPLCGTKRATPDVSLIADPNVGVAVYDSTPYSGTSGWQQVGGTSAATPMWAGRAAVSGALVDAQDVYGGSRHYRDVVSGSNRVASAGPGYDLVTGRGSWIDPPPAPTGLTASVGDSAVALTWTAPTQGTVTSYTVYRSSGGGAATAVGTSSGTSYTDTQLQDGTAYTYTVTASNATAEGPASDAAAATPSAGSGGEISGTITDDASPANPLSGACATAVDGNGTDIRVAKSDSQGGYSLAGLPPAGYSVRFDGCDAGRYTSATYTDGTSNPTVVTVTDGADASAINGALAPAPPAVPGAPTGVTAVAGEEQAAVSWTAPADDGGAAISGYVVTPYAGTTKQTPVTVPATPTSATVTGLVDGTAYTFTVAAINNVGTGAASAASAAVTPQAAVTGGGGGGSAPPPSGGGGGAPAGGGGGGGGTPPVQPTTASSSNAPVSSSNPVVVSLTDPAGGTLTFTPASSTAPPAGLDGIAGGGFVISATPAVDAAHPLVLTLQVDPSLLPDGRPVVVARDGVPVTAACAGSGASPDPCISSYAVSSAGVVTVTILSTHASTWSLARPTKGSIALACGAGQGSPFSDVPANDVHLAAIDCLNTFGIAKGTSVTAYNPGGVVTRGEMAAFIARLLTAAGAPLGSGASGPFTDVPAGSTFAQAINQLAAAGVANGVTATTYQPNAVVTRGQMAAFLVRAYELAIGRSLPTASTPFTDIGGSAFAVEIGKAWEVGITQGMTPTTYVQGVPVVRDQMASFIARTLNLLFARGLVA